MKDEDIILPVEYIEKLQQERKELNERTDKAIKYIEDRMIVEESFCLDMKQCYELTGILKGSDVDKNIKSTQ